MQLDIHFDLELVLLLGTLLTGFVWFVDKIGGKRRKHALEASLSDTNTQDGAQAAQQDHHEPWFIEACKSFFPILLIVLILRSFVAESFRIPSGSMMPTLLHGDFILVNKFSYGIRLPVLHAKVLGVGAPKRGDVAVFRFPANPSIDYIKRVIGLPGDRIEYKNKTIYINGKPMLQEKNGIYQGQGANAVMNGTQIYAENLETNLHDIMIRRPRYSEAVVKYVPEGHYFVMGDNRDHSSDSRSWGFVPEENLVGHAFLVWMNWDFAGSKFNFDRIGKKII